MFHDGVYFTALDQHKGRTYYAVNYDQKINCNIISVVTERPENELGDLLRGVRNFIRVAENTPASKRKRRRQDESAPVRSFLIKISQPPFYLTY